MRTQQLRLPAILVAGLMFSVTVASCGGQGTALCSGVKSVSDFVARFGQGLDNFSEDQYTQLRLDSLDAYDVVKQSTKDSDTESDALKLLAKIQVFLKAMDDVSWDVSQALESDSAVNAAGELGTPESLREANSVESYVISECGLPTSVPFTGSSDTLPSPSIPSPTATDPDTNPPNETSENEAQGQMVATQFGLTLSRVQVICLGRELQNIGETTTGQALSGDDQSQFQTAFDACGIRFTVPSN